MKTAWSSYKLIKKHTQKVCKAAYEAYVDSIVASGPENNPKHFWSFIKAKRTDHCGVAPLTQDGLVYINGVDKANIFNRYFNSVYTKELLHNMPTLTEGNYPDMAEIEITLDGVVSLLQKLKPFKACGPDQIPNRILKEVASEIAPALLLLYQSSFRQAKLPDEWKHAYVTPIFKEGNRSTVSNYRPVSLTCVCCKMLEHIMYSSIMAHLDRHKILSEFQHGFRKQRSCESQLLLTVHDIITSLNAGDQLDAIVLDFSKAFDRVPHKRLCMKLEHYGIRGPALHWLENFLSDRTQQVVLDGCCSDTLPVTSGVPQGTVLAPLLFLCYINDLPELVSCCCRLYADDVLLYKVIRLDEDCASLQSDLDVLQKWADDWQMRFNGLKCQHISFCSKQVQINFNYMICNEVIKQVDSIKYLGVIIDKKITWSQQVDKIALKANRVRGFLYRNIKHCSLDIKNRCYKIFIQPILEYASIIWSPYYDKYINKLEAVQRRMARFVCNEYGFISVTKLLENLSWPKLQQRRTCNRGIMLYKILNKQVEIPILPTIFRPNNLSTRGNNSRFIQLQCHLNCYRNSFFPDAIRIWNSLPQHIIDCSNTDLFRDGKYTIIANNHICNCNLASALYIYWFLHCNW